MAVNPSGEWLGFGCSNTGQLLVWEWQSETYILKQQGHYYNMNSLCYSQDGHYIATGGDDGKVSLTGYSVYYITKFLLHTCRKMEDQKDRDLQLSDCMMVIKVQSVHESTRFCLIS